MNLNDDFKEFIQLLNSNNVEYLLVGGYAVAIHGQPRYTGDIDFWINPTFENANKVMKVLNEFGFASINLETIEFTELNQVFQFGYEPNRIDIITSLSGLEFESTFKNKKVVHYEGVDLYLIDVESLKKNKLSTGRNKDLADLENI